MRLIQQTTTQSCDECVARLKAAAAALPMGVVAHINGQANAAKQGLAVAGDQIVEIFRPDFAVRVWRACRPAGLDIPIRVHVYQDGDHTIVAYRAPSQVFAPYGVAELDVIGAELDPIFATVIERALRP